MKTCSQCKIEKDISLFNKDKNKKDGLRSNCKDCDAKRLKKYREENKEHIAEYNKNYFLENKEYNNERCSIYREENKEHIAEYNKNYYLENKEYINERNKQYREENKEQIGAYKKQYQEENKEYIAEYKKQYREENKEYIAEYNKHYHNERCNNDIVFKLRKAVSSSISRALRRNGSSKNGISCLKYLNYSIKDLKSHLESQFETWMSWDNYGNYNPSKDTWQIDHIIPQSKLPYVSMEDDNFKECWSLTNLQPLSAKENLLKGNRK